MSGTTTFLPEIGGEVEPQDYMTWPELKSFMEAKVLPHFQDPVYFQHYISAYINKLQDWDTGAKQLYWITTIQRYGVESVLYLADLYTDGDEELMRSMILSNAYTGRELRTMLLNSIVNWFEDVETA